MSFSALILLLFYLISRTNSLLMQKLCKFKSVGYDFRFRIVAMFKPLDKKHNFIYVVCRDIYDLRSCQISHL
jgi:hypothetical protein